MQEKSNTSTVDRTKR